MSRLTSRKVLIQIMALIVLSGVAMAEVNGFQDDEDLNFGVDNEPINPPKKDIPSQPKEKVKTKPSPKEQTKPSTSSTYTPWKDRDLDYYISLFDSFSKALLYEHQIELGLIILLCIFGLNYLYGSRQNEGVVLAWANCFALHHHSTLYGRNFALVGLDTKTKGSEIIFRENQSTFKCYASGRRFCKSVLTTLKLKNRQDLVSLLWNVFSPVKDKIVIEVSMNEQNMQPLVFAIAKKKVAKSMINSEKDLQLYAKVCEAPRARVGKWPKKLTILSETKDLHSDLISEMAMKNIFNLEAFRKVEKYFESLHFTTEKQGPIKHLLKFEFNLPKEGNMSEISNLMEFVFHEIDVVGALRMNAEALKRANKRRADIQEQEFKKTLNARQEAAQKKREDRFEKEKAQMTPAQIEKLEEKRSAKLLKKQKPRAKMMKG